MLHSNDLRGTLIKALPWERLFYYPEIYEIRR